MDRGQTCDIVGTPPKDTRYWPAVEDFEEREEVIKWRDNQQGTCKLRQVLDRGHNKDGPSVVLKLEHENGPITFVWEPSSLAYALQNRKHTDYILNLGMRRSEETGNTYYDFKKKNIFLANRDSWVKAKDYIFCGPRVR